MNSAIRALFSRARWLRVSDDTEETNWATARAQTIGPGPYDYDYHDGIEDPRVCAIDQVMHLVVANLQANASITAIIPAAHIEVLDFIPRFENRAMPRISVSAVSGLESEVIVNASTAEVSFAVAIRTGLTTITPVPPGQATIESVVSLVKSVLLNDLTLSVPVAGTDVGVLDKRRIASERMVVDLDSSTPDNSVAKAVATRELTLVGSITIDKASRRIYNVKTRRDQA